MSVQAMSPHDLDRYDFVPQAVLKQPPAFFASRGAEFRRGQDDLDEFEVSELSLDEATPFALHRYCGTPADETTVFLPDTLSLTEVSSLISRIVSAFDLPAETVKWHRTGMSEPY